MFYAILRNVPLYNGDQRHGGRNTDRLLTVLLKYGRRGSQLSVGFEPSATSSVPGGDSRVVHCAALTC